MSSTELSHVAQAVVTAAYILVWTSVLILLIDAAVSNHKGRK